MPTILDMPNCVGLMTESFDCIRTRDVARMEGRRTEANLSMTPYWVTELTGASFRLSHIGEIDAFLMAVDEGAYFRAYDTSRPRPIEYPRGPLSGTKAGGGAFDGTGTLQSITDSRTIVVNGLPANWQLRAGDYVEVRDSTNAAIVSLHRVAADAKANASGVVTISIKFFLPPGLFSAGAVVNFEKAAFIAQTTGASTARRRGNRGVSFSAQEMFPGVAT